MLCVIGGACSGRRALVAERYPQAVWHRLAPEESPAGWDALPPSGGVLVVTGWGDWLKALLATTADDEAVRTAWRAQLSALEETEREAQGEALLILDEMGCGIVPMAVEARRLRDLNGWLSQEVASRSRAVWQVRHGLCKRLK
ncbi:MAG: bifunctional adenosylcobinamide kinase/adenosylcobinamide-phosphate guanylyltransferase [Halomonas sp.]|uniref:bifunctional adenosylcobinamide kinase/adenosylcobinamide-phosphate guanylyltransferase n=1 Tax=Halomonas sp. TaxID=1486246 RepID=UPI001A0AC1B6|nr:bifunctional adenosylcobinamide kinase/adenosylcobinamide-phosphate guanylyltransferase [Halomonas sp.]MBE0490557.1 bifunctional adenosylcobinamide kinase/adenosylcobinamide-phosphate guanylyltransferase [Halomonas sp.]